jgi:hypothetical protein
MSHLQKSLESLLARVEIRAWRLLLETPQVEATVPMLRGVWGRALRHLDEEAYRHIFVGDEQTAAHRRVSRYILRPAPPDPATAPAVEWILLGVEECLEPVAWRAWDVASGMGLGPQRIPFRIREHLPLSPSSEVPWKLSDVNWPLLGEPAATPCCLAFSAPVRLLRRGALLTAPSPADIAIAALRRVAGLASQAGGEYYRDLMRSVVEKAAGLAAGPWHGERCDLVRWSGAQRREIDLYGVSGSLDLPGGPDLLWPLLAAACWTHIGKGTVFGLGQLRISATSDRVANANPN